MQPIQQRSLKDIAGLFLAGIAFTFGSFALSWFLDENLHLSKVWWLFVTGNTWLIAIVFLSLRRFFRSWNTGVVLFLWGCVHLMLAFVLVGRGVPNFGIFVFSPIEAFLLAVLLQLTANRLPKQDGHPLVKPDQPEH